ncbi:type I-E CRISPR-associated protein Cse2/CasB [Bifidobacterium myosotis]|nr:type I-E CRISPR-associated protein Cse2/CasB [Bifidobacterium myosotis]
MNAEEQWLGWLARAAGTLRAKTRANDPATGRRIMLLRRTLHEGPGRDGGVLDEWLLDMGWDPAWDAHRADAARTLALEAVWLTQARPAGGPDGDLGACLGRLDGGERQLARIQRATAPDRILRAVMAAVVRLAAHRIEPDWTRLGADLADLAGPDPKAADRVRAAWGASRASAAHGGAARTD